jgi:hypothetical protein
MNRRQHTAVQPPEYGYYAERSCRAARKARAPRGSAGRRSGGRIGSFTDKASNAVHRDDDRLHEAFDLNDGESFLLRSAVGQIDDLSLQEVTPVEFHKNLGRIGDIYVAYSEVDPSVSHIGEGCRRARAARQVSARLLASPMPGYAATRSSFSQQRKCRL